MFNSMLDNDQYKFAMQNAVLKSGYAAVPVEYKFQCRTPNIDFTQLITSLNQRLKELYDLRFTKNDIDFLKNLTHLSPEYFDFLESFRFIKDFVKINFNYNYGILDLRIKGPWFQTILFETPLLAIISELYAKTQKGNIEVARLNLKNDLEKMPKKFRFAEFGTRRRYSSEWQEEVLTTLLTDVRKQFDGTSNCFLARKYNLAPLNDGMAHEWLQAHQQLSYNLADSQKMALKNWLKIYHGNFEIALSDNINTDAFLKDFEDSFMYKTYSGIREDSEPDPIKFGLRMVDFYINHQIDSREKTIIFSNGLDFKKAYEIHRRLYNLININFGIGTKLTNNWDFKPLNIVIKMVTCNGRPVAKISNSPSKGMCESPEFLSYLKSIYR